MTEPSDSSTKQFPGPSLDDESSLEVKAHARPTTRSLAVMLVPILAVLITFLFWYQTWFGRPLSDAEMAEYLAATSAPHKIQHALAQLGDRLARGDHSAQRWSPQILALATSPEPQLRAMAAWAMGQDNHSEEFHQALRKLLGDSEPLVRWNAALGLVRFTDAAARPQLREMLQLYSLRAPQAGALKFRVKSQAAVHKGSVVARIDSDGNSTPLDVVAPVPGTVTQFLVADGASVDAGRPVALIAPEEKRVWESLRALYVVGEPEDLEDVERYARGVSGLSPRVQEQAQLTAQAIRQRSQPKL